MEYDNFESAISRPLTGLTKSRKPAGELFSDPDFEIIAAVRDGDVDAFGKLVRRYEDFVFTLIRSLVGPDAQAEDIAQEAFLRAYKGIRRFELRSSFKTWLYRIAYNTTMSHIQREKRSVDRDSVDPGTRAVEAYGSQSLRTTMERLIGKLRPEHKAVIMLHYYDDLKYEEIAEILDCPLGTVKVRIYRAKHELKKLWTKYAV